MGRRAAAVEEEEAAAAVDVAAAVRGCQGAATDAARDAHRARHAAVGDRRVARARRAVPAVTCAGPHRLGGVGRVRGCHSVAGRRPTAARTRGGGTEHSRALQRDPVAGYSHTTARRGARVIGGTSADTIHGGGAGVHALAGVGSAAWGPT